MGVSGLRIVRGEQGGTLVESMIAFMLFAASAVGIYPLFIQVKEQGKHGDVLQLCENVVKGKLEEYRLGRIVDIASEATGVSARFQDLSVPSLTATNMNSLGSTTASAARAGGFYYAKYRYNRFFPGSCNATAAAPILVGAPAADRALGLRECISGGATSAANPMWQDTFASTGWPACAYQNGDAAASLQMPGFRVYVKLELDTPWQWTASQATIDAARTGQYHRQCPNAAATGFAPGASIYDFNGAGDGIKVTVTGVISPPGNTGQSNAPVWLEASGRTREFGGIPITKENYQRFSCRVSTVIRPDTYPVRYYLTRTGRIQNISGRASRGRDYDGSTDPGGWPLSNIYNTGTPSAPVYTGSGITGFAVHPRNFSVWVAKPGAIVRYGNCGGVPLNCSTTSDNNGISDEGVTGWPSIQEFRTASMRTISSIAVDFVSGKVYGMDPSRNDVFEIRLSNSNMLRSSSSAAVNSTGLSMTDAVDGSAARPSDRPVVKRFTGFFMDPGGEASYISDMAQSTTMTGSAFMSTIYRHSDTNLEHPVLRLPVDAVTFSK